MKAAYLKRVGELVVEETAVPECPSWGVLVRVKEIGICGSDLHYFNEGRIGDHVVTDPHILGHEASGMVAEVGRDAVGFAVGDRVCIEPGVPCMSCEFCRRGRYNLCEAVRFSGAPPYQGMLREYLVHDPRFLCRLPDSVSFTQGALAEPLAVAHNAIRKAAVLPGDTVLITGAGPIGLSCVEMALVAGASMVVVSEPKAHRRDCALSLGAGLAVDPRNEDLREALRDFTGGRMVDCAIEASGSESAIAQSITCIRKGGRVVFVGMGKEIQGIPHAEILRKEAVISGIYRYANDFSPVIELLAAGRLRGEAWVSHRYPLSDIVAAFGMANDATARTLKVVVHT
ncbi:MAG: NAD(P)-dependent alcohol dehydrogenase [Spirochaetota bacterium]